MTPRMYPETLEGLEIKSNAERKLYEQFSLQLGNNFSVFYSVGWIGIREGRVRPSDGETDFIIVNPYMGILILEVKGGIIGFNDSIGWYSIRNDGSSINIKDPFEQAKSNKYDLIRKIESLPDWYRGLPTIGHAVAFPDGNVDISDLGLSAPQEIVLLSQDLPDLDNWVRKCFEFWAKGNMVTFGEGKFDIVKNLLRKSWLMREPRMGEEIELERTLINKFTDDQMMVLDLLSFQPRAAIRGCAGSGKTVLARQKAIKLAKEGFTTLLTCYNRNLADDLNRTTGNIPRLTIMNFHALCQNYAGLTGFSETEKWNPSASDFFDEIMPEALAVASEFDSGKLKFDAIVVDEGQDFDPSWWLALEILLKDQDNGIFYVFYDDNQKLYERPQGLPVKTIPVPLGRNCRNTRTIHEIVEKFYRSDIKIKAIGPQGRDIIRHYYADNQEVRKILTEILSRLIYVENIDNQDIVILSPSGMHQEPLSSVGIAGVFRLVDSNQPGLNEIYTTTIRLFKGLEKPVVILLIPEDFTMLNEMVYVGSSRATAHLELIISSDNPHSNRI